MASVERLSSSIASEIAWSLEGCTLDRSADAARLSALPLCSRARYLGTGSAETARQPKGQDSGDTNEFSSFLVRSVSATMCDLAHSDSSLPCSSSRKTASREDWSMGTSYRRSRLIKFASAMITL